MLHLISILSFWRVLTGVSELCFSAVQMYELYDPVTIMFFYRNRHIQIDLGTGNNNKINWPMEDKQELIDIFETVYRGAKKGRGLVVAPKDYSTKYKY